LACPFFIILSNKVAYHVQEEKAWGKISKVLPCWKLKKADLLDAIGNHVLICGEIEWVTLQVLITEIDSSPVILHLLST
jgi:hypothetical protein